MEAPTLSDKSTDTGSKGLSCKTSSSTNADDEGVLCSADGTQEPEHKPSGAAQSFSQSVNGNDQDGYHLELGVEGIHCASCIRLIENAMAAHSDVTNARVNMSTERLSLSWRGTRCRGDALTSEVTALGYKLYDLSNDTLEASSAGALEKELIKAIAVAGFAAGNLMLISVGLWSSTAEAMGLATQSLFHWVSALVALPTILYAGRPFFRSAYGVLKGGHTNMDVPISLAVILAAVMSISETLRHGEHVYFDSAVMLLFFLLIGRYLDARAKGKARSSAAQLLSKLAGTAAVYRDDQLVRLPLKDLQSGMRVLVTAGENIPADGHVVKGASDIDLSLISGETLPEFAVVGTQVFAGTVNLTAPIEVSVDKVSNRSLLSEIVRMMEVAEQGAAKYVRLADKAASLYTPVVHSLGALTFLGWWLFMQAQWQVSLLHAVTVLIITCPCALGLAVPVVQVLASGRLLKQGVLLKSGDALERLANIDTIVFDKTGTLTIGKPKLLDEPYEPADLKLAASLAVHSRHPLSRALAAAYHGSVFDVIVSEVPGKGLTAKFEGKTVRLGSALWCGNTETTDDGKLELWLDTGEKPAVPYLFADTLRVDAAATTQKLQRMGLKLVMLSGDRKSTVAQIADQLAIEDYHGQVTPPQKYQHLTDLKAAGRTVLMVGDGLNDAPALAAASVSMSPSSAIDITQNTADIVFQGERLAPVLETLLTARHSTKLVKQNFGLAVLYNIVAVPLAVVGLVTPLIAAAAMSGSSLIVILNAFRIKIRSAN